MKNFLLNLDRRNKKRNNVIRANSDAIIITKDNYKKNKIIPFDKQSLFNELSNQFNSTYANIKLLSTSCNNFQKNLLTFNKNWFTIMVAFDNIFKLQIEEITHEMPDDIMAWIETSTEKIDLESLIKEILKIYYTILNILNYFENTIQVSLNELENICYSIERTIKKRNLYFDELNRLINQYDSIEDVNMPIVIRQNYVVNDSDSKIRAQQQINKRIIKHRESRKLKLNQKINMAREKYEIFNKLIIDELLKFNQLVESFMQVWFTVYFFTILNIFFELQNFMTSNMDIQNFINYKIYSATAHYDNGEEDEDEDIEENVGKGGNDNSQDINDRYKCLSPIEKNIENAKVLGENVLEEYYRASLPVYQDLSYLSIIDFEKFKKKFPRSPKK
ncbi:hypothetical protein TBLA_0B06330 [Henningerozyma blattae CBS 6284]|uniref:BAR domain-containing protein n=1 Tax=Henningerozyma blattae (strain ATCC 34711 / CBS 6284 / DSM 70876 / NBRC 10599 / NRRL Y-10934 / UCD 77-7) TaxID=1071380 RepID=I2GZA5_HENB6|nr:hypothetical protein TBLA_0B06330 [Tetrapisispora blattae CBS 6284]CCH59457.1 hypothetical protein TBLA_0B06330 [Tetrapisispora blattae CBS 6284]